jgi:MFS family permease
VVLAYDLTGSATLVAALTFVRLLPNALFLPFVLILALGVSDVFSDVASTTVLQTGTPDELLGRVFGAFESTLIFSMLIGAVVIGPLIDLAGPRAATVILTLVSVALLIVCLPRLRRMEDALGVRVFFRQVPVLASLPHRVIDDFASLMRLEKVPAGTDIVRQGERGATDSTSSRKGRLRSAPAAEEGTRSRWRPSPRTTNSGR